LTISWERALQLASKIAGKSSREKPGQSTLHTSTTVHTSANASLAVATNDSRESCLVLATEVTVKTGKGICWKFTIGGSVQSGLQLRLTLCRELALQLGKQVSTESSAEIQTCTGTGTSSKASRAGSGCWSRTTKETSELALVLGA
jgi:hypothetical protein